MYTVDNITVHYWPFQEGQTVGFTKSWGQRGPRWVLLPPPPPHLAPSGVGYPPPPSFCGPASCRLSTTPGAGWQTEESRRYWRWHFCENYAPLPSNQHTDRHMEVAHSNKVKFGALLWQIYTSCRVSRGGGGVPSDAVGQGTSVTYAPPNPQHTDIYRSLVDR